MSRENRAVACLDFPEVVLTAYNVSSKICCPTLERWTRESVQVSGIPILFSDLSKYVESITFMRGIDTGPIAKEE